MFGLPVAGHALLELVLVASLQRSSVELAGQRLSEVLSEVVAEETVDDRVNARVGVCQQMQERHDDALAVPLYLFVIASFTATADCVELGAQLRREERKPADGEQHNDYDEHAHCSLPLGPSALPAAVQGGVSWRFGAAPETANDASVGAEHGDKRDDVEQDVEEEAVGDLQTTVREVFGADEGDAKARSRGLVYEKERLETLDEELRTDDDQRQDPEDGDEDTCSTNSVQIPCLQRVTDGVVPTT